MKQRKNKHFLLLTSLIFLISICLINNKVFAAQDNENVVISTMSIYKDMDYSFLKTIDYGNTQDIDTLLTFDTVEDMQASEDIRLRKGKYISTLGYYSVGDLGGAKYVISDKQDVLGAIQLKNGLYANYVPDIYTGNDGTKWAIISIIQFGAKGDGIEWCQDAINTSFSLANTYADKEEYDRTIIYMPEGEYKVTNQIQGSTKKVNFVGEGDKSVIFTDNDYRKNDSYDEPFFACWNTKDSFYGFFKLDAREKNWTRYMRQMCLYYCQNMYLYGITYYIPQEAWIATFYEDKQYTNLTIYTGDKQITVDNCIMYQMSGTYRGANIGIMDFWSGITEDITIMNCELHDNARDEQIGIFSVTDKPTSQVHNVDFINNKVYAYSTPYKDIHGHRTMCFTVAYNGNLVDDINISDNHFICEIDSKFMTFGAVTNCKVKNNIIELLCSMGGGYIFDSSNGDSKNILIDGNQFHYTKKNNSAGTKSFYGGKLTFSNNRVVSDFGIYKFADVEGLIHNNRFISLGSIYSFGSAIEFCNNNVDLYSGHWGYYNESFYILNRTGEYDYKYNNNTINDYTYYYGPKYSKVYDRLGTLVNLTANSFTFNNNIYNLPNYRYTDPNDSVYAFWYRDANISNIICKGNNFQGVKSAMRYDYPLELNTFREFTLDQEKPLISSINITHNGQIVNEVSTVENSVSLDKIVKIATEKDDDGNVTKEEVATDRDIVWISSIDKIASVNQNGQVTRNKYGSVYIYATSKDGSTVYGKVKVNFIDKKASDFNFEKEELVIKPNQEYDVMYEVTPRNVVYKKLNWSSKDENIVTVDSYGKIKGINLGETEIVATTRDGSNISKSIRVKVESNKVTKISLNRGFIYSENIGEKVQLEVTHFTPEDSINKEIGVWDSNNENVATVDQNGLVTIVAGGYSGIHVTLKDGSVKAYCGVYVKPGKAQNLTATATKSEVYLKCDAIPNILTYNLYRYNTSTNEWDKVGTGSRGEDSDIVEFKDVNLSSNTEYKYYVKGFVKSWETGQRIEHEGDESNVCTIKTTASECVRNINLRVTNISLCPGNRVALYPKYSPGNAENVDIRYEIGDTSIAEIENVTATDVTIKAKAVGETIFRAYSNDEFGATKEIPLIVSEPYQVQELEGEADYNTANFRWKKIEDEDNIDGYIIGKTTSYELREVAAVPKEDLCKATFSDGEECYLFVDTGLKFGTNYSYGVVPYYYKDGLRYTTNYSKRIYIKTDDYYPVESIVSEKEYILNKNEEKTITVEASNENASRKQFVWYSRNKNIFEIKNTTDKSATIKGLTTGIGILDIVANDEDCNFVTPKIVVLPDDISNFEVETIGQRAELSWDVVTGATGYNIYKYNDTQNKWEVIDTCTENTYTEYNLEAETNYKYKVSPFIADEEKTYEGNCTNEVSIKSGDDSTLGETLVFNSNKYKIKNGYVYQIKNETTKGTFLDNVNTNGLVKFIRPDGSEVGSDELIGTGMTLRVIKAGKKEEFKVAVEGDLSGDGCVTAQDYSTINKVVLGILTIENEDYLASDLDYNGEITATDLSTVNKMLLGII